MSRSLLLHLLPIHLLLSCVDGAASTADAGDATRPAVVQDTIVQETLVLLRERLAGPAPVHSTRLVEDVAKRTGRSAADIRAHLRRRLDEVPRLADSDTLAWRRLLGLRAPGMSQRQARRLLRELLAVSHRALADEGDYLLGTSGRYAASQAHVPAGEAAAFIHALVAHGIVDTTREWTPEPRGLVVSGWTEPYEFSLTPLYGFFATEDEAHVREAVRDVQRFIVPRLVRLLPASRGVHYAVRDRDLTSLIDPDFEVRVTVVSLRFGGTNADLLPCMDAQLDLRRPDSERSIWHDDVSLCTSANGSANTHDLDAFYDEVAAELFTRLDEHFETPQ